MASPPRGGMLDGCRFALTGSRAAHSNLPASRRRAVTCLDPRIRCGIPGAVFNEAASMKARKEWPRPPRS